MADLHAAVLAELDRLDPHRLTTLGKVTAAVIKLHQPQLLPHRNLPECAICTDRHRDRLPEIAGLRKPWPCWTMRTIARELGVDHE